MHALFSQFSGLVGLFVFLSRVWKYTPAENAALAGLGTALAVFLTLLALDAAVRRVLAGRPVAAAASTTADRSRSASAADFESNPALASAAL